MPQIAQEFDKKGGGVYGFRSPTKALGEKRGGMMDIFVGMGFRTDDNMLGVVKTVDEQGRITRWCELWNQDFKKHFPMHCSGNASILCPTNGQRPHGNDSCRQDCLNFSDHAYCIGIRAGYVK